jgi:hypothetical protein
MQLGAPIFLAVAGAASVWMVALHLLSFHLPRPKLLPTARFVPANAARSLAPRVSPSDPLLLALRVLALLLIGLALSRPHVQVRSSARARVIAADQSRAVADRGEVRDSVTSLIESGTAVSVVAFDTIARVVDPAELLSDARAPDSPARLSSALVMAIREAFRLRASHDSVEIVLVSPLLREELDASLDAIRATWTGELRLVRVTPATPERDPGAVDRRFPPATESVGAAVRLAAHGGSATRLRVSTGSLDASDSAFARNGGLVVQWATAPGVDTLASLRALIADNGAAAIGHFLPVPVDSIGSPILRWESGAAAAYQRALGAGCVRYIGAAVGDRGDEVIRPAFLALVRQMLAPCSFPDVTPATSDDLQWMRAPVGGAASVAEAPPEASLWLVRALLALALAALLLEWALRARRYAIASPPAEVVA